MTGFYESIAAEYDEITGEADRAAAAEAFLAELRRRHRITRALDVACGSGLHAVLLARAGVDVTGTDLSRAMLAKARARAADAGVALGGICCPMQEIARHVAGPFDAILCLGNSLPHLLDAAELDAALAGFASLLADGGVVALHLLNYARVLARRERIVGITRGAAGDYVRFYDFLGDRVRFNVLTLRWRDGRCEHELAETLLRPYRPADVERALGAAGLERIERYGGIGFEPFDEGSSETLLLLARRA